MRPSSQSPQWKIWEDAVGRFVEALQPHVTVHTDVTTPDKHTQTPRQRDVLLEVVFGGLFSLRILVSCKRLKRKLHQGDIDTFFGEIDSAGANKGVLYSFAGYTQPAIDNAKGRGISCCTLYEDQPAALPEALQFRAYCCSQRIALSVTGPTASRGLRTWNDLFDLKTESRCVLDALCATYEAAKDSALNPNDGFPSKWSRAVQIRDGESELVTVFMDCSWRYHEGKLEAHLLNGSYSFTDNAFAGTQAGPMVSLREQEPGPGWVELDEAPKLRTPWVLYIRRRGDLRGVLRESYGPELLPAS